MVDYLASLPSIALQHGIAAWPTPPVNAAWRGKSHTPRCCSVIGSIIAIL